MTTPTYTLDPTEVQMGVNNACGIYVAPEGTPGPTDLTSPWASPWSCLGYISDDGPTVGQSTDSTSITPWQSVVPIRTIVTGRTVTLHFIMWQINPLTLSLYFDADAPAIDASGMIDMAIPSAGHSHVYAVGIDSVDNDRVFRIYFTRSNLSDVGDMQIQRGAAIPLETTLTALDDQGTLAHILHGPVPAARSGAAEAQHVRVPTPEPAGGSSGRRGRE